MDARTLLAGDYIDAVMIGDKRPTLEISEVEIKPLEDLKGKVRTRGILAFRGKEKRFPLNTTNLKCIIRMFGFETDDWIGRRLTLYTVAEEKSESGRAIRVWGSPDIPEDIKFSAKIGTTPKKFHLHRVESPRMREPGEEG